jgi:hypothetical protein
MSFVKAFNNLPFEALLSRAATTDGAAPRAVLDRRVSSLADFATHLSPAASNHLEEL